MRAQKVYGSYVERFQYETKRYEDGDRGRGRVEEGRRRLSSLPARMCRRDHSPM